jgi:hypothetical protein
MDTPAFYAGFRDLGFLPDRVRAVVRAVLGRGTRSLGKTHRMKVA